MNNYDLDNCCDEDFKIVPLLERPTKVSKRETPFINSAMSLNNIKEIVSADNSDISSMNSDLVCDGVQMFYFSGKGAKDKMIEETTDKPFKVAYEIDYGESTSMCYNAYNSYDEFKEIIKEQHEEHMRFYELYNDSCLPECYDLDAGIKDVPNEKQDKKTFINRKIQQNMYNLYKEHGENFVIKKFLEHRKDFLTDFYPKYLKYEQGLETRFAISTSCDDSKFSVHIVVRNGLKFKHIDNLKYMLKKFQNYLQQQGEYIFDISIYSPARQMRMLGNTKNGQKRYLVKHHSCLDLDNEDFLFWSTKKGDRIYNIKIPEKKVKEIKVKEIKVKATEINFIENDVTDNKEMTQLLNLISSDCDYNKWGTVKQCIYDCTNGSDEGLEIFTNWSKKDNYTGFDEDECYKQWSSSHTRNYDVIPTLKKYAKDQNPDEYDKLYPFVSLLRKNELGLDGVEVDDKKIAENIVKDFTHNNLAKIYSLHSKGEIFYTTAYGWIIFNDESKIWTWGNDKTSLIEPISSFFSNIMKKYCEQYFNTHNLMKMSKNEEKDFLEKIKWNQKIKTNVGSSPFVKGIIEQIQSLLTKDNNFVDKFDAKPNLMAFSDGKCIDVLNKGEVRDIVKEDYIITTTGYPYPQRDGTFIQKWNDILNSLSDDKEQIKSLKTLLSLGFWGGNKNEIFAQLTGSGGNGKGLADTGIQVVYGNYYKSINSNQLTAYEKDNQRANSELASCRFARIVMATEPEDSYNGKKTTLKVPTLKKWTGGDVIQTRFLHKDVFRYTAKFTLMMQLNDLLDLSTNDDAIKRRMRIIELPFKFVEKTGQKLGENEFYRDDTLKTTIIQDNYRNALFYILLDTWLENNGRFYQSKKVKEITGEFFQNQNPVKLWFDEIYEFDRDSKISVTDLFNKFKNDNYDSTLSLTAFGRLLKECCKNKKSDGKMCYYCKRKPIINNG